jgi:hypothetical protein
MSDNVTVDVFEDGNGKICVTFRGPKDWVRLRMSVWCAWWFVAAVRLRKLLRLPLLPCNVPASAEFETGLL